MFEIWSYFNFLIFVFVMKNKICTIDYLLYFHGLYFFLMPCLLLDKPYPRAAPPIWRWGGGGAMHWKVGFNTVKTLKFEKGGAWPPRPKAPMVAPPLALPSSFLLISGSLHSYGSSFHSPSASHIHISLVTGGLCALSPLDLCVDRGRTVCPLRRRNDS